METRGRLMKILFSFRVLLVVLVPLWGILMLAAGVAGQSTSEADEPWNPCDESLMGGPGDWAVFHIWCFKTGASRDVDTFAKDDILRMEAQCPDTHFAREETIRREGQRAILYKSVSNSKFGVIFIAYYKSGCGVVRQICRAGNEEAARYAYSNFLDNVRGDYGNCIR
jgi:hypothetical protein